ncbi:MAG: hypothetical protein CMQ28_07050 [Gammaproteobacteria bacterium]|nr:hypothetical protein [Gammaproteobacteria bacterium]|tara:strand:- start:15624 stop:16340 length:717 start_codon:yes stop_codon:yes gene_type:complete
MKTILSLIALFLVCSNATAQLDTAALERAMANPDRPAAEKERDAARKAPQVLAFAGLEPGMTALDIIAAGGWYTEVLSYAVGDSGRVIMQNAGAMAERYSEAIVDKEDRLSNIELLEGDVGSVAASSVDFAITALNFHDVHNSNPQAAQSLLGQIATSLKPGGIFLVIDHEGTPGADNVSLHRISFDEAVSAIVNSGQFALVGASDVLDNAADDHTVGPFDPSLGRNTDRIVLKFVKI